MLYKYRNLCINKDDNLKSYEVLYKETALLVKTEKDFSKKVLKYIVEVRRPIETYIKTHPEFKTSLKPILPKFSMPEIIKNMCEVTTKVNVGPMASVAGTVSEYIGKKLLNFTKNVIIENGGDIFCNVGHQLKLGIYCGDRSIFSNKLAILVKLKNQNLGICSSSGILGHSLSFGKSDLVVIISSSAAFSDALATATGNMVKTEKDLEQATNYAKNFSETHSVCIIKNRTISFWAKDGCCELIKI
ncbi:MAG: UPF0280 family protein [Endomicrobiia bacterium]